MGNGIAPPAAVATIAAMVTPALLIVGAASLVASALVRMGRVVDRARVLAVVAQEGSWEKLGATPAQLTVRIERHRRRAHQVQRSIVLLDAALRRLTQAGVIPTSVASIAGQLAGDFTQPKGGQAVGILYEMASG